MASLKGKEHLSWAAFRQSLGFADDLYCLPASPKAIGIPAHEDLVVVSCSICSRPVLQSGFTKHFATCRRSAASGKSKTARSSVPSGTGVIKKKRSNPSSSSTSLGHSLSSSSLTATAVATAAASLAAVTAVTVAASAASAASAAATASVAQTAPEASLRSISTPITIEESPSVSVIAEGISPVSLKTVKAESSTKDSTKKVKGPINLDLQCGVIHDNGVQCARSITCKIHSVSLKRAVVGRTFTYDALYQEYQAKASLARGFRDAKSVIASKAAARPVIPLAVGAEKINQEEEVARVMAALRSHRPCALVATATPQQQQSISSLGIWMSYKSRMAMQDVFRDRDNTGSGFQAC
ncbi:hypothetical protein BASA82_000968 [Batrachochytrium salamandrivorans]|nr:hypothetical protein BASA62_008801 [Batrachochytrium salamandrivorans]KAH6584126.1 hypothetical protein BASA61_007681 [Batrachochytrium salamandrivorans]KAH9261960.1 hypothetical protein BASA82_000968 [Batrachochytrium salamandrivorans]